MQEEAANPGPAGFNLEHRKDKYGEKQSSCSEQHLVSVLYEDHPTANCISCLSRSFKLVCILIFQPYVVQD